MRPMHHQTAIFAAVLALITLSAALSPSSFLKQGLKNGSDPFLDEDWASGFVKIRDDGSDLFYWMFRSRSDKTKDPLVFWLSGGPGCSSELAVFYENGPFHIKEKTHLPLTFELVKNNYSWNTQANVVYMDQPVGTGYSKNAHVRDLDVTEKEISKDFYTFLLGFFKKYPEFVGRPMFITGESYAGHYIPAISAHIVSMKNKDINFVGAAIGNGLVDPYNQYPEYVTFAEENGLIGKTIGEFDAEAMKLCQILIRDSFPLPNVISKFLAMEECQLALTPIIGLPIDPRFNLYDIRENCTKPPLCYDFSNMDKFLARKDVINALNVTGRSFSDCKMNVHLALLGDWMNSMQQNVTLLLENNINVLVYSGDKDFICNWRGGEKWTHETNWTHKAEF